MKLLLCLFFVGNLFAETLPTTWIHDVTAGIIKRNWALTKEADGIKYRTMWFTNRDACEAFKKTHYKEQAAECVIYDI